MRGLKAGAMAALMLVLVVCSLCAAPADATFLPWLNFWKKGMMGYPAYPAYKGAKTYDAQGASAASAAAASPPVAEAAFVDPDLGLGIDSSPLEMTRGQPSAFPISVTNNGQEPLDLVFSVIETPGPDGESAGALEVLGIRPKDGVPNSGDPRSLRIAPGETVEAEIALLSPSSASPLASPSSGPLTTGATIVAEDPKTGRAVYTDEPLEVTIEMEGAPTTREAERGGGTCVPLQEVLSSNGDTDTFARVWQESGAAGAVSEGADFALLAPTDAAFEELTATLGITMDDLLASPKLQLLALHHLIPTAVTAEDLATASSLATATCDEVEVSRDERMSATVAGCGVSATDTEVCGGIQLFRLGCVLPPPPQGTLAREGALCLPEPAGGSDPFAGQGSDTTAGPDGDEYEYEYDFDFEMPSSLDGLPPSRSTPDRRFQDRPGPTGPTEGGSSPTGAASWGFKPVATRVVPTRLPAAWDRLEHLANSNAEPVKATFLPPGWREWITPGTTACPATPLIGDRGLALGGAANALRSCGRLEPSGPLSYQIQPPPEAYRDGFIELGDTYVWQSVQGASSYCTPASADGSHFKGSVVHEASATPRGNNGAGGGDLMLFLLQNPLNGDPWQVVSMQTSEMPGTSGTRRLKTMGQGCFLWVVATAGEGGEYDFHLSVTEA